MRLKPIEVEGVFVPTLLQVLANTMKFWAGYLDRRKNDLSRTMGATDTIVQESRSEVLAQVEKALTRCEELYRVADAFGTSAYDQGIEVGEHHATWSDFQAAFTVMKEAAFPARRNLPPWYKELKDL